MPELPEVETTRRGLDPHVAGRRIAALTVYEPRLRWRVPDDLPAKLAGQRITGTGRRAKYLLIELESGTLLVHLGMSGIVCACCPRIRRASTTTTMTCCSSRAGRCDSMTRAASAVSITPAAIRVSIRCSPASPRSPSIREFDAQLSLADHPTQTGIDQAGVDEQSAGRRCRQHLRQRGAVSREDPAAAAGAEPDAAGGRRGWRRRCGRCYRWRSRSAEPRSGIMWGRTGSPGYFRQKLYVYERAGKKCRVCRTVIRQLTQQGRSTYYCPSCQK